MNIEALTADLDAVFQRHGITGNLQICMQVAFSATLAEDSRRELLERLSAGGALFVIDDAGSISCAGARESVNATRLKDVLDAVTPEQFGRLMHMFLEELTKAGDACQCPSCATKRTSTHGSLN